MNNYGFRNVVLCDDIREELGGKKSLMGIFPGDIFVQEMPAAIQVSMYAEYVPNDTTKNTSIILRLYVDEAEIAKAQIDAPANSLSPLVLVLPKGVVTFDKSGEFRITAAVNDGEPQEIIRKQIAKIS